jgi:hypothetical protein
MTTDMTGPKTPAPEPVAWTHASYLHNHVGGHLVTRQHPSFDVPLITLESAETYAAALAEKARQEERERLCAAIKAEDDHCADGDYMLDSDDCIAVIRGTWKRPEWDYNPGRAG